MPSTLQQFRAECVEALDCAIERTFPEFSSGASKLAVPSSPEFGELASSIAYGIARHKHLTPHDVATSICRTISITSGSLIAGVEEADGYINFRLDYAKAGPSILSAALQETETYGLDMTKQPIRISVEHTSSNPAGPITMATARNSMLGDALARILRARGHQVIRRFYVDDVGRQVSILAYGYSLLNKPQPEGKGDHWFGHLYACINCAVQLETTKRRLATAVDEQQAAGFHQTLDEWIAIAAELDALDRTLFESVVKAVQSRSDPGREIEDLARKYEENDQSAVQLIRSVVDGCLQGVKASLLDLGISFDKWDWESDILWKGAVKRAIERLAQLPFTTHEGSALKLNVNGIVDAYELRNQYDLSPNYDVPSLMLVRSDGTTLYSTRDIAYSLLKFEDSDRVINVIATEQTLPQLQIRLALFALGEKAAAANMIHYAYGLVELPGTKMSKRRAHYVTLDEVVEQAKARVDKALGERKTQLSIENANQITESLAGGAIKFAMLGVNSTKNLTFTWDRVLSLEKNSALFINYAYTRAGSILRKLGSPPKNPDCSLLTHPLEHLLLWKIGELPDVFVTAADQLKPEELTAYASVVAEKFHEYYEIVGVIHAAEEVKNARAALVAGLQVVLRNAMKLVGISLSERM